MLRQRLLEKRKQQAKSDTNRGALLMRGRLYTWVAGVNKTRKEQNKAPITHIAGFWSMPDEPELQPLLYKWADEGMQVSLPAVLGPDQALQFKLWDPEGEMKTGAFGIQEPDSTTQAPAPDLVLVPTLGFTRQGDRLGYGKGYYDRTLAALREQNHHFLTVGLAWACGDLSAEDYTPQAHDFQLDAVLTDKGWAKPAPTV
ncbi:5-formyltetrahydrofolate cyclo-ligase [Alcaligenaceae bacterium 429]|nr:5-formyltetrahydrofolate cyclo-ligase [Alcaligenaceae bacterium 429]